LIDDPDHSEDEARFILLGLSSSSVAPGLPLLPERRQCHSYHLRMQGNGARIEVLPLKVTPMRKEYDFSKSRKNPYASQLKKQITIRLDEDAIAYFKAISEEVGIPYQSLINLYLRDCAASHRKLDLNWK
jgi:uncharacterized protein (DUF4415 family)